MRPKCRACEAPVRWARTAANDRPIPLDPEPAANGNVILDDDDRAHVLGKNGDVPFDLAHLADRPRYMPHHATCPNWTKR